MIDEREIRAALERPLDGDQEACERAWRVVSAAAPGTRTARSPRRGSRPRLLGALGAAVLLAVLAATPPGTAVSEWVQDGLGVRDTPEHTPSSDELRAPPGGGELLVGSAGATWVVRGDGSRRRLGPYRAASWSPNGLFVAAVRDGRQLLAVTPTGTVRWALSPERGVAQPRWAPSGLRIAYRSAGAIRAVSGDGSGDAELVPGAGAAPVAWRPQGEDELAVSDRRGRVKTVSAVTGRILWTSSAGERPTTLSWSRDGRRLAAVGPRLARVLDRRGRTIARLRPHRRARFAGGAYSPRSAVLALVEHRAGGSAVYLSSEPRDRPMFASAARLTDLTWSPDGRWLLVGSPAADQWLFLRGRLPHRVVAISDVAGQFDPAGSGVAIPRVAGWCCGR